MNTHIDPEFMGVDPVVHHGQHHVWVRELVFVVLGIFLLDSEARGQDDPGEAVLEEVAANPPQLADARLASLGSRAGQPVSGISSGQRPSPTPAETLLRRGFRMLCEHCHLPPRPRGERGQTSLALYSAPPPREPSVPSTSRAVRGSPQLALSRALPPPPMISGESLICLSCHDGSVAGALMINLGNSHPVGVPYPIGDKEFRPVGLLQGVELYGVFQTVECPSCHDVHAAGERHGETTMLRADNRGSGLCVECHQNK